MVEAALPGEDEAPLAGTQGLGILALRPACIRSITLARINRGKVKSSGNQRKPSKDRPARTRRTRYHSGIKASDQNVLGAGW
jgi:hypothetical protein